MNEYAIRTVELARSFGGTRAVDGVSFDVRTGEIFGFLGPNGAGKTTTIRMLCTLLRPTSGTATVAGYDIRREDHHVREHIGLVSEKMIMYDRLTARENLKLFAKLYNLPNREAKERIDELLALVHMERWGDSQIGTFSTGMKQRINVIRALLNRPEIIFLDEPTLGLDPQTTREIREFIRRINAESGTTIILTTHMMSEADLLCDRIGIIDFGRIVALDSPANLKRLISGDATTVIEMEIPNLSNEMVQNLRQMGPVTAVDALSDGRIKIHARGDEAFDAIVDSVRNRGGRISAIRNRDPSLEDVFLKLTGHTIRDEVTKRVPGGRHRHRPMAPMRRVR